MPWTQFSSWAETGRHKEALAVLPSDASEDVEIPLIFLYLGRLDTVRQMFIHALVLKKSE